VAGIVGILATALYKVICLLVGLAFAYLGYRLFVQGIFRASGDLQAEFKDTKIILKRAAPGTFFSVLGAAIVIGTILAHFSFGTTEIGGGLPTDMQSSLPSKPPLN
jgi:hypothetical protein